MASLNLQATKILQRCKEIYILKEAQYSDSLKYATNEVLSDKIFIKAFRCFNVIKSKSQLVDENLSETYQDIINYAIERHSRIAYAETCQDAIELMSKKNNDYGDVWKDLHDITFASFIVTYILRIKALETKKGNEKLIDEILLDIINYSIFAIIKLTEKENKQ